MLFLNGIPFFFMELAIGQWFSAGVIGVWKSVCPLMKGKRDSRSYKKRRPRAVVILSSEPRAAGEKVKLCKLEVKNEERLSGEKFFPYLGLHPRSSWLRRTPFARVRDLPWLKKKSKRLLGVLNKKKRRAVLSANWTRYDWKVGCHVSKANVSSEYVRFTVWFTLLYGVTDWSYSIRIYKSFIANLFYGWTT